MWFHKLMERFITLPILQELSHRRTKFHRPMHPGLIVYPNPAHDKLTMGYIALKKEEITISVYDLSGRVMTEFPRQAEKGMNQFPLQLQLMSGNYIVVVHSATETIQKKLVIQ